MQTQSEYPRSLAIEACCDPFEKKLDNLIYLGTEIEPVDDNDGFTILNPNAITNSLAPDFIETSDGLFTAPDPRLIDEPRGQRLHLDSIPVNGNVKLKDVYDPELDKYKIGFYDSYDDINNGQITYYVSERHAQPYFPPLFTQPLPVSAYLYKDPMGGIHPEYARDYFNQDCLTGRPVGQDPIDPYCLTALRDESNHRQDILASQMSKIHGNSWSARWF